MLFNSYSYEILHEQFHWIINEYCKCCVIATAMKFYTNNFIEYIYKEI